MNLSVQTKEILGGNTWNPVKNLSAIGVLVECTCVRTCRVAGLISHMV